MRNETALRERKEIAYTLVLMGKLSDEEIAEGTKLPIDEVKRMAAKEGGGVLKKEYNDVVGTIDGPGWG